MESETAARGGRSQPLVEEAVGSSRTMERVAAAKKIIENDYRERMKNLRERNERYRRPPVPKLPILSIRPRAGVPGSRGVGMIEGLGISQRFGGLYFCPL